MNRKLSKLYVLLVLIFGSAISQAFAQAPSPFSLNESPLPAPTSPVMDYANVLDANTKQTLEQRLIEFRDKTNPKVELAVAIVKTTAERPIFDYSLAVARGWKIGSKEQDNPSALLMIAVDDRKYFTQISKDLEDELPDGLAGQLQRQYLVPAFRQQNYGKGISDTIEAYIRTIEAKQTGTAPAQTAQNQAENQQEKKSGGSFCNIVICLIVLFFFMLVIFSRFGSSRKNKNDNDRWRGGGFGGGGGVASALPWIIGSILTSGGGGSSSSGWGGGSSSGGGDSWGGFGGGGDFGGGGAGGDW